jgi:hypothetical protein
VHGELSENLPDVVITEDIIAVSMPHEVERAHLQIVTATYRTPFEIAVLEKISKWSSNPDVLLGSPR